MWHLKRRWTSSIAIDLGHDAIKLLQVDEHEGVLTVRAAASERFPLGIRRDERWGHQRHRFAVDAIRGMIRCGGFRGNRASVSLTRPGLNIARVQMADQGGNPQAMVNEARRALGLGDMAGNVSYVGASQGQAACETAVATLVFGAGEQALEEQLYVLEEAELVCRAVEPAPCAVGACFSADEGQGQGSQVIVDMGQRTTTAVGLRDGRLQWAQQYDVGGYNLTERVSQKLGLAWEEAEELRWKYSGRAGIGGHGCGGEDGVEQMITDLSRHVVDGLAASLQETINCEENAVTGCEEVLFTGGEARGTLTARQLSRALGMRVRVGQCFAGLEGSAAVKKEEPFSPHGQWAVAMGMCVLERNEACGRQE